MIAASSVLLAPAAALAQDSDLKWEDAPADEAPAPATKAAAPAGKPASPTADQAPSGQEYSDKDPRALTDFASDLEPYGYWRDDPTYGRVWVPDRSAVGADFAPYVTSGHWAVADDGGWIWVSDYPFGWVVFHYGRWVWISGVGWAWIPGRRYAHAWVVWRTADAGWDYVGWAPMPPDYVWWDGVAVGIWFGVYTPWVFCPSYYVYHPHVHAYIVHDHYHVHEIATHTHRYYPTGRDPRWAGPSHKAAHVPASAVPKQRVAAHPKAIAASKPKGPPPPKIFQPGGKPRDGSGSRSMRESTGALHGTKTLSGTSEQPLRTARPSSSFIPRAPGNSRAGALAPPSAYRGPSSAPAPGRSYTSPWRSTAPSRSYSPPSRSSGSTPSYRPAPSRSSPPSYRPAPSYRPPAPAPAPSYRPAPAPSRGGGRRR